MRKQIPDIGKFGDPYVIMLSKHRIHIENP